MEAGGWVSQKLRFWYGQASLTHLRHDVIATKVGVTIVSIGDEAVGCNPLGVSPYASKA